MWLLMRVAMAFIGFALRIKGRLLPFIESGRFNDMPYQVVVQKTKHGVHSVRVGVPFRSRVHFKLSPETNFDRFFKILGVSTELQTGDREFDNKFYIASDHPYFHDFIRNNQAARETILDVAKAGYTTIWNDFDILWVAAKVNHDNHPNVLNSLFALFTRFDEFKSDLARSFHDKFYLRALIVEALVWAIAGYAIGTVISDTFTKEDIFLNGSEVFKSGATAGIGFAVIFCSCVYLFLRGSSKCHRVITESFLILLLAVPFATAQLAADINIKFDSAKPIVAELKITNLDQIEHRGRRGRRWYSYHVITSGKLVDGIQIPSSIKVHSDFYFTLNKGQTLRLVIGRGFLNLPWYRELKGV